MGYGMNDWLTVLVLGMCLGAGWALGNAVMGWLISLIRRAP